jgi:RNA polymerase sigma factor (sigma-70 family)
MTPSTAIRAYLIEPAAMPPASPPPHALLSRVWKLATTAVPPTWSHERGQAAPRPLDDRALLDAWLGGDAAAFETLALRYLGWLVAHAARHLAPSDADDAAQNAFAALITKARTLPREHSIKGFPFQALRIEILREQKRAFQRAPLLLEEQDTLPAADDGPERTLLRSRDAQTLAAALDAACSPLEQEVLLLWLDGESLQTIAAALDITDVHVRVLKHRALGKLRRALDQGGDDA